MKGREYTAEAIGTGCGTYFNWKENTELLKKIRFLIVNRDDGYNRRPHVIGVWKVKALKWK